MSTIRCFFIVYLTTQITHGLDILKNIENCPKLCTCKLEHLTETGIYRFMQSDKQKKTDSLKEITSIEYNDVLYDDNLESVLTEDKTIIRSAICILQTETEPATLIQHLSPEIESLTLIQGFKTGSKTVQFSYLEKFKNLVSLELLGPNSLNEDSQMFSEINTPLPNLKYINLENIFIKNSKEQIQNASSEQIFEYVQKSDRDSHPITLKQYGVDENQEIIPYEKFKELIDKKEQVTLFTGFKNLFFMRITNCHLNNIDWTMFDGLKNLQFLHLERNNLKFIPPFAFYGTPNLKSLSLAHNSLLDIQITDLAGLLELEHLDLSFNNFSQLSELSLPPFPKLKLANFGNNPVTVVFPNTFQVMNTTDSLIIGSNNVHVSLLPNSFSGLTALKTLILTNVEIMELKRDFFNGMLNLNELVMTGNITSIQYDCFIEVRSLERLILSNCNLATLSMDAFVGLGKLALLDLSNNQLESLPPGIFDHLVNVKEIHLNLNRLRQLPRDVFSKLIPKLLRLNDNPWHCSCQMSEWKPVLVNRIKQKIIKSCRFQQEDKGVYCANESRFGYKYKYSEKVAPKCAKPKQYHDWSVFQVMRKLLKCKEYKPKFRKHLKKKMDAKFIKKVDFSNDFKSSHFIKKLSKKELKAKMADKLKTLKKNEISNEI